MIKYSKYLLIYCHVYKEYIITILEKIQYINEVKRNILLTSKIKSKEKAKKKVK